ncbi:MULTISPECIES: hypothetical protein [unclassified Nocardiopsis]|uniref:hypothetical protein n=1 Tax=unclassified Nocardiopsis TaxID=2649073 RepID=UPI00116116B9|nr:hypothetical protein [Nocardiopsis sp. TSRI0078]
MLATANATLSLSGREPAGSACGAAAWSHWSPWSCWRGGAADEPAGYALPCAADRLSAQRPVRRVETGALRALGTAPPRTRSPLRRKAAMTAVGASVAGALASAVPLAFAGMELLGCPWPVGPL